MLYEFIPLFVQLSLFYSCFQNYQNMHEKNPNDSLPSYIRVFPQ